MSAETPVAAPKQRKEEPVEAEPPARPAAETKERPPQTEELLCTICGMRSCWR